jgi:hypothetical protein
LGALWWIDFTDSSTLTFNSGNIATATDKISSVVFSADPGGPAYDSIGYLGVSGDVRTNASKLKNNGGEFPAISDYVWFGRVYDDGVSQRGGKIITAAENPGFPTNPPFIVMQDNNSYPYPPGPVWNFQDSVSSVFSNISFSNWTNVAIRSYYSGSEVILEVWENGSIIVGPIAPISSPVSFSDPVFALMYDGGIDFNTEQFFFDKFLTDSEITAMFNYLNNKY